MFEAPREEVHFVGNGSGEHLFPLIMIGKGWKEVLLNTYQLNRMLSAGIYDLQ